jgi:hypothetical protein
MKLACLSRATTWVDTSSQPELLAYVLLHLRIDCRMRADGAAHASHGDLAGSPHQTLLRTVELRHPARDLETKGDRLGHDAVSAPGHQRAAVADRQVGRGVAYRREVVSDEARRLDQLHRRGGVVQVLARHPQVHVAGLRLADRFVQDREECDHVVADASLDLGDLLDVEGALPDLRQRRGRDAAKGRPGLACENLDAEPQLETVLVGPDRPNRRRRVSLDQEKCRLPMITGWTGRL